MTWVAPFESGRYRKVVLAAVERRGGPEASDAFELYDLPVAEDLDDTVVRARIEEVWGFWQKQRDHPKYGALVARLVEGHAVRSAELLDAQRRRFAARRVLAERQRRDEGRYRLLDAAIERLRQRHGQLPADKIEGLVEFGVTTGLSRQEVLDRLAAAGAVTAAAGPAAAADVPVISAQRRRQLQDSLAEFGLLNESPAPVTLLAMLDLGAGADTREVRARAAAWRSRARELPPQRLRAVIDELLVHVAELLEPGPAAIQAYLDAVAVDVTTTLRPQLRAAVMVEDRLVGADHAHLLGEAQRLGLDAGRARQVIAGLAAEVGAAIEASGTSAPSTAPSTVPARYERDRPSPSSTVPAWYRRDRPPPARSQASSVDPEAAAIRWRAANEAMAGGRCTEAVSHLEQLRTLGWRPVEVEALLARAHRRIEQADGAVAAALAGPQAQQAAALLAVAGEQPDHPGALAELARLTVLPPRAATAVGTAAGQVEVSWQPSPTPGVSYKVRRQRPDGSWHVVGRSAAASLTDGGAPPGSVPVYEIVAVQAGRLSAPVRTDQATDQAPDQATDHQPAPAEATPVATIADPTAPVDVRAAHSGDGSVVVTWSPPLSATGDVEYRVRCQDAAGRWRVVGRTRGTTIGDGGAMPGVMGVYAVSASVAGVRSTEARTAGS